MTNPDNLYQLTKQQHDIILVIAVSERRSVVEQTEHILNNALGLTTTPDKPRKLRDGEQYSQKLGERYP